ncbi:MAG: undecaprenyl-diphosphate phosphatase [Lachnospiraceae bacterium]|nr:undecaprenyl-diphosphate phosphatase [Lachnospiraceae bacterium]
MEIIEILKVIIFGIVEGVTEWLPISSTGHLILLDEFVRLKVGDNFLQAEKFKEMFDVVIQLGAIMAVLMLNWQKLWPFFFSKNTDEKPQKVKGMIKEDSLELWKKVLVASLPAAIIGLLLDDWLDLHFYNTITVSITLIVYGIFFIMIENRNKTQKERVRGLSQITYQDALYIGMFQMLALIPGTSRSGATILGALLIGLSRGVAAEFSFYLAIPVMFGASLLKIVKFFQEGVGFTGEMGIFLGAGMITAFIVSVFAVKFLLNYVKKRDFKIFGWYRIFLGILVLIIKGSR